MRYTVQAAEGPDRHGWTVRRWLILDWSQTPPAVLCSYTSKAEAEDAAACFNMAGAVIV